jgi:multicomponent Na+:H+ antiporter subunit G
VKQVVVGVLAFVGLGFSLSGAVGILRMPDVYTRIQCSTKNVTMGALPLLLAVVIAKGVLTPYGGRALLIAFLLLVLSPVSSHALARAAYRSGVKMWPGFVTDVARRKRNL